MALIDTGSLLGMVIPETILDWVNGDPDRGGTIAALEARNKQLRSEKKTILAEPNVADHADWYTDAVFGQQQLTGVNPTTLTLATSEWLSNFKSAALAQQNDKIGQFLQNAAPYSLYMQDCSWFRKAVGAAADEVMVSDDADRWATASVSLFHLNPAGKLHPLAIFIDWKGTAKDSVCSFNRRLQDSDSKDNEATDWPWRYAKTCSQISDWVRHEVQIHLVNTHFVEEAGIVACHRCFPSDHPVFQLLQPHWLKTLSLNAAARAALVPAVVTKLVGISDAQTYRFMTSVYEEFDWEALYIPNDLKRRGFPEDRLFTDPMFHNYAYGKDMSILWRSFHKFVSAMLRPHYKTDNDVLEDIYVGQWVEEMRRPTGANLKKFPDIRTFEDLVNAAVMMIHIASVEHTAVNYLQEYYQSFVINKPPALCTPPVASVAALQQIDEVAYMRSLPVDRPRQWLLASHLPHLLSFRVSEEQNLLTYAASKAKLSALNGDAVGRDAATGLWNDLTVMIGVFQEHSDMIDEQTCKYEVLNPHAIANSILI